MVQMLSGVCNNDLNNMEMHIVLKSYHRRGRVVSTPVINNFERVVAFGAYTTRIVSRN